MNKNIIIAEIEQSFGKTVFNHKIHEKQAEIYKKYAFWWGLANIVLSALTSSGLIALLLVDEFLLKLISAIISLLSTGINLYTQKYDYEILRRGHKNNANSWLYLRERYTLLITDIRANIATDENEIVTRRNELNVGYQQCARDSLSTTSKAYELAEKALNFNQDNTISLETINSYLPPELRRESSNVDSQ